MAKETATQRKRRLEKEKQKRQEKLLQQESEESKSAKLAKRRKRNEEVLEKQRNIERANAKQRMAKLRSMETNDERISRLETQRVREAQLRAMETDDERISRMESDKARHDKSRAMETDDERISRLETQRIREAQLRPRELSQEREERLRRQREAYAQRVADVADFHSTINSFCDKCCEICQKKCYPNQVVKHRLISPKPYFPPTLVAKYELLVCYRCNTHLKSQKSHAPSKAYWNNLLPGDIPGEIAVLTEPERRLLQRIIPYVKVIKFPGRFGQYGFKGHATLFALDIITRLFSS